MKTKMMNPHRYLRALALPIALAVLAACATSNPRDDIQQAQGLTASGRVSEAYGVLQSAAVKNPEDKDLQAALTAARVKWGSFVAAEAADAVNKQRWDAAELQYQQLSSIPGFEQEGKAGIDQVRARREQSISFGQAVPQANVQVAPSVAREPKVFDGYDIPLAGGTKPATPSVAQASTDKTSAASASGATKDSRTAATAAKGAGSGEEPTVTLEQALDRRVSLQFRDASVRSLFDVIGKTSGLNVIFDRDVSPDLKTTVFLKNTTIKSALDKIVLTSQLAWRAIDDDTLLIYNDEANKQNDYQALNVRSFMLANADAKLVASSLRTVLKFKDVVVDPKLNMVIVRDTPESIRLAEKLVAMHDVPEAEVMLEIEVIEVSRTLLQNLGIQWPGALTLSPLPSGTITNADGSTSANQTLTLNDLVRANSRTIGAAIEPLSIRASRRDNDLNLLANPRIRAKNREKAKILIGERIPNINATSTNTGFVAENITYIEVGLKLEAEPQIFAGDEIVIKLALEVSAIKDPVVTKSGSSAFSITTRNAATVLRLKDGENQILAGLIQDIDRGTADKVPGLGDLPLLGRLFGSKRDDTQKTEIVLSITPRLIRNIKRGVGEREGFESGTVSSVRGRGRSDTGGSAGGEVYNGDTQEPQNVVPQNVQNEGFRNDSRRQDREE